MKTNKKSALIIATVSSFISAFMGSSINIALPDIEKTFSMDALTLSWVATAYLLTAAVFLVPFGRLADLYGRKKIYTFGISVFTLSSALSALAFSSESLIIFRVVQGIGSAMIFSTSMAILSSVFTDGDRGRAFGISVAATYLGLSMGPFLGGILTNYLGWRSIFWVNVPAGLVLIYLVLKLLKGEWAEAKGEKFDIWGSIILSLSLIALMIGMSKLPDSSGYILLIFGILGIVLFVNIQNRIRFPLIDLKLFSNNRVFALSNLAAFINYSATFAVTFLLSLYLQYVKGLEAQQAGLILVSQPIVMAIFSPLAGRVSDKTEPRLVASLGMLIVSLGLGLLSFVSPETSLYAIVIYLIILGFGFALFSSPNTNAVMSSVEKKSYGIASSILGTMRITGQMFSMGIAMLIFSLVMGKVKITPEVYLSFNHSMQIIFGIFTILCVVGIFASYSRGKVHK
ncbi:MAG: MFS transporter [Bacteroidales bacterium]|jgi:EmrB/QacA subfamily drug resistance transporter|nr:MFS transporter [Bacteroidales bacterium]